MMMHCKGSCCRPVQQGKPGRAWLTETEEEAAADYACHKVQGEEPQLGLPVLGTCHRLAPMLGTLWKALGPCSSKLRHWVSASF